MKTVKIVKTRFAGATNTRGSRIVASCDAAAKKLVAKCKWKGRFTGQSHGFDSGYDFIFSPKGS